MPDTLIIVAYLFAGVLFIKSLGGLAHQKTARRGNMFGIVGMALALVITFLIDKEFAYTYAGGAIVIGGAIGAVLAARVAMTSMPELVAILHSFVGLAAVLVGFASFLGPQAEMTAVEHTIHEIEIYAAVAIGAITFTGSIIAYAKLAGKIGGSPLLLPGRHGINVLMVVGLVVGGVYFVKTGEADLGLQLLIANTVVSGVLGLHLVAAIGGADMPVVVSLLNSYSGWAAAAAGFMLSNDLLIVTGALVGSSGAILSYVMCRGMNRSIWNVVFGGFGTGDSPAPAKTVTDQGEAVAASPAEVAEMLCCAQRVVIIPGYGMAVARAQHAVSELTRKLRERDVEVLFGIHPVAGRMPGHMNVLLAEADIPYDTVLEMDDVNPLLEDTDVALVIGANDIVNPDALVDDASPIFGMPQLEVWHSGTVVVFKRSLSPGYAGVANPLFFRENTKMCFGDAHDSVTDVLAGV